MASKSYWDRLGIALSGVCTLHCLSIPIITALLPFGLMSNILHEWMHPILFLLIVPTVYFAVRHNCSPLTLWSLLSGLVIIAITWMLHDMLSLGVEAAITSVGSLLLIAGHWQNYRSHNGRSCIIVK